MNKISFIFQRKILRLIVYTLWKFFCKPDRGFIPVFRCVSWSTQQPPWTNLPCQPLLWDHSYRHEQQIHVCTLQSIPSCILVRTCHLQRSHQLEQMPRVGIVDQRCTSWWGEELLKWRSISRVFKVDERHEQNVKDNRRECMIREQSDDNEREIDEKQTLRTSRSSGILRRDGWETTDTLMIFSNARSNT